MSIKREFSLDFNGHNYVSGIEIPSDFYDQINGEFRINRREIAYATRFGLTVYHDDVTRPDGKPGIYGHVKLRPGIYAVPYENGNVYMINSFVYPKGRRILELITGGIDEEDPLAAVKRELKEEAGICAKNWEFLGDVDPLDVIDCPQKIYLATDLSFGNTEREVTEDMELVSMPLEKAVDLIGTDIRDGPSCIGLFLAFRRINFR